MASGPGSGSRRGHGVFRVLAGRCASALGARSGVQCADAACCSSSVARRCGGSHGLLRTRGLLWPRFRPRAPAGCWLWGHSVQRFRNCQPVSHGDAAALLPWAACFPALRSPGRPPKLLRDACACVPASRAWPRGCGRTGTRRPFLCTQTRQGWHRAGETEVLTVGQGSSPRALSGCSQAPGHPPTPAPTPSRSCACA